MFDGPVGSHYGAWRLMNPKGGNDQLSPVGSQHARGKFVLFKFYNDTTVAQ